MSTSAADAQPLHKMTWRLPTSEDGSINLNEAPTADLVQLAAAILFIVRERRSEGATP